MDLFGRKAAAQVNTLQQQMRQMQDMVQQRINSMTLYPDYRTFDNADRYCTTDDIYSIVKLISTTAAQVPIYTYIKKGKELEDAPEDSPLSLLVECPFEGMGSFESYVKIHTTLLIQGECFLWKERPEAGPNAGKVVRLHYLEPQSVNIKVTQTWPRKIVAFQYAPLGEVVMDHIPAEEVIHIKYFNPRINFMGNELRGLSPLAVLAKRLTRVDSNNDVATAQLQNGGVPGILVDRTPGMEGDVVEARKRKLYQYFTSRDNVGMPYSAVGDLEYIELGLKLVDMQVAELGLIDFKKLCNAFGISARLFNNDATGSENSDKGARVGLYTNCIIPNITCIVDSFNASLSVNFKDKKYFINYDVSEVSELQADYAILVAWLEKAWWLTPNEKREMMKYSRSELPLFDEYLLPTNIQTAEDFEMLPPTGDYGKTNNT